MTNSLIEIFIVLLLISFNGILAMAEIAMISSRKIRLQQMAEAGNSGAKTALILTEQPGRFLSTVQIGITLVGILAGAFGGATIAKEFGDFLGRIPLLEKYADSIAVGIVVLLITYLSLVLGELAPKRIGLNNAEKIASALAPSMERLSRLTSPLVHFLSHSTSFVLRIFGFQPSTAPAVTEEEIRAMIGQGADQGVFEPIEEELVDQVFRLGDERVQALMTPRIDVDWLDLNDPLPIIKETIIQSKHSYLPAARGSLDQVVGIVSAKELLNQSLGGQEINLKTALQAPLFVPENTPALVVLERFQEQKTRIALVIDEYGGIQGVITATDILEAIAGDFPGLHETSDPDIIRREDGSLLLDGLTSIIDFLEAVDRREPLGSDKKTYQTLGGFVMATLGRIPQSGDTFEWEGLKFEVMDMDGLRVDKILVTTDPRGQEPGPGQPGSR